MAGALERIHAATVRHAAELEVLPATRALLGGTLPAARRASLLRALRVVHAAIDAAVGGAPDPRFERALAALGDNPHAVDGAALAALSLAQQIRVADRDRLRGLLHVLDDNPLVARLRHAALGEPGEPPRPAAHHLDDGRSVAALDKAIAGAAAAWEGLENILGTLGSGARGRDWLVIELNPNAGMHALPDDLREIEAALLAGEETWRAFPYYGERYGESGRRFTGSDAAWLVTLARDDHASAMRHIDWLTRLLASRGMPRLLMEVHLEHLERSLAERLPERAARYTGLGAAARALREERLRAIPEARAAELIQRFAADLEPEANIAPREAATLLVAAAADEAGGVVNAERGLTRWLADSTRFSRRWRAAVDRLLEDARRGPPG